METRDSRLPDSGVQSKPLGRLQFDDAFHKVAKPHQFFRSGRNKRLLGPIVYADCGFENEGATRVNKRESIKRWQDVLWCRLRLSLGGESQDPMEVNHYVLMDESVAFGYVFGNEAKYELV